MPPMFSLNVYSSPYVPLLVTPPPHFDYYSSSSTFLDTRKIDTTTHSIRQVRKRFNAEKQEK